MDAVSTSSQPSGETEARRRVVLAVAARLEADLAHARHVARLAVELFDVSRTLHRMGAKERAHLEDAALLHDVGVQVAYAKHHRHSQYLIAHADLPGFGQDEIRMIAAIARFHRGAAPEPWHEDLADLAPRSRRAVIELAAVLRVADGLDRSHLGIVTGLRAHRAGRRLAIDLETAGGDPLLELSSARHKAALWERSFGPLVLRVGGVDVARLAG